MAESIRQERVAVIPFTNSTGDAEQDYMGDYCSFQITNGLTEAGIKSCSQGTIQQYEHLFGVPLNNPGGKVSFSEVTGARYWIEGHLVREGDSLIIKSQLTDGWTGETVRNFPNVTGHIEQKERLVDQLTRRIMGFWVAKEEYVAQHKGL